MNDRAAPSSSMRRDVLTAYVATVARAGSWAIIASVVIRRLGTDAFALLALARGALSILNYGSLGVGTAMIHRLSTGLQNETQPIPAAAIPVLAAESIEPLEPLGQPLAYANPTDIADPLRHVLAPLRQTYAAGLRIALFTGLISAVLLYAYASNFQRLHEVPRWLAIRELPAFVLLMGLGAILRLIGDAPAAVLQVRDRIARDNVYQAAAEVIWVAGTLVSMLELRGLYVVGTWYALSGAFLFLARLSTAATITQQFVFELPQPPRGLSWSLLAAGAGIMLGQLANYLYAPAAMILINRMLDPELVAYYEAAVQIDGALLLLVSSLAAVVLPKTAVAHAGDDLATVRHYYVRGTVTSVALLAAAAMTIYALSPWIFPLWLGNEMSTTRAILPLVLISTVVGGSGMVGRSILLGMGKVKAFTITALMAGVANVVLGFVFVKFFGLGLRGIVFATMIVVVARAGLWLPWYIMRTLRKRQG